MDLTKAPGCDAKEKERPMRKTSWSHTVSTSCADDGASIGEGTFAYSSVATVREGLVPRGEAVAIASSAMVGRVDKMDIVKVL